MKRLFSVLVLACTCLSMSAMLQQGNRAVSQRMINHAATKIRSHHLWQKSMGSIEASCHDKDRIIIGALGGHWGMFCLWMFNEGAQGPYIHPESLTVGTVIAALGGGASGLALYYAPIALWYGSEWLGREKNHEHTESQKK